MINFAYREFLLLILSRLWPFFKVRPTYLIHCRCLEFGQCSVRWFRLSGLTRQHMDDGLSWRCNWVKKFSMCYMCFNQSLPPYTDQGLLLWDASEVSVLSVVDIYKPKLARLQLETTLIPSRLLATSSTRYSFDSPTFSNEFKNTMGDRLC